MIIKNLGFGFYIFCLVATPTHSSDWHWKNQRSVHKKLSKSELKRNRQIQHETSKRQQDLATMTVNLPANGKVDDYRYQIILFLLLANGVTANARVVPVTTSSHSTAPMGTGTTVAFNLNGTNTVNSVCAVPQQLVLPQSPVMPPLLTPDTGLMAGQKISGSISNKKDILHLSKQEVKAQYENVKKLKNDCTVTYTRYGTLKFPRNGIKAGSNVSITCFSPEDWRADAKIKLHVQFELIKSISSFIPRTYGIYQFKDYPDMSPEDWQAIEKMKIKAQSELSSELSRNIRYSIDQLYDIFPFKVHLDVDVSVGESQTICFEEEILSGRCDWVPPKLISDRALFEDYIGHWAIRTIARVSQLYHSIDYIPDQNYIVYHIGDKQYLFEPGMSPRHSALRLYVKDRLIHPLGYAHILQDYEKVAKFVQSCYYCSGFHPTKEEIRSGNFRSFYLRREYVDRVSNVGLSFMEDICAEKGLFASIQSNFKEYEVSPMRPVPEVTNIKHYYVPEQYLTE